MKRATRQAPSEIADWNFEKSIDSLASVGMLAKEAERFRRGRTGTKEVAERRSQAHNGSACAPGSRDGRERRKATSEGRKGALVDAASVGHGAIEDFAPVS